MKLSTAIVLSGVSSACAFVPSPNAAFSTQLSASPYLKSLTGGATIEWGDYSTPAASAEPEAPAAPAAAVKGPAFGSYLDSLTSGAASVVESPAEPVSGYNTNEDSGYSGLTGPSGAGNSLW
mmetsp:Transcript_10617/g.13110  ORF Transcript_10617/g.13110 Transcript_10617/m.13110 type:complete len:122 (-) Transcript_10617:139-504(-)|eukprot:CAMPEP_0172493060 /NCGR_PEP_ID=MMETSP1066-20121228/24395_1 /TAXON_ID=671091 /ORGANISM="Coscinodiscus wailesii, Strain CCMP2513" /LENGTH=121 /DNA_ID=CAMNT_0013263023 /DNA_START=226 /DNA_END=588 /DNA_ORIENTATION=+